MRTTIRGIAAMLSVAVLTASCVTGCGKEKSEAVRWFCPECGQENTGKFCSACGTKMPENVRSTPEVKRITPTIKKPGVK